MRGKLPHVRVTDDFVMEENDYNFDDMIFAPVPAGGGVDNSHSACGLVLYQKF
jgi:hypothetical protein